MDTMHGAKKGTFLLRAPAKMQKLDFFSFNFFFAQTTPSIILGDSLGGWGFTDSKWLIPYSVEHVLVQCNLNNAQ